MTTPTDRPMLARTDGAGRKIPSPPKVARSPDGKATVTTDRWWPQEATRDEAADRGHHRPARLNEPRYATLPLNIMKAKKAARDPSSPRTLG